MNAAVTSLLFLAAVSAPSARDQGSPDPSTTLRRFALVAGANSGGPGRPSLRYAIRDAERFTQVVTSMGGVNPRDATILREPTLRAFNDALATLSARAAEARTSAARVEVLIYYSGHADEEGVLLGADRVRYTDLRAAIRAMPVDVGITILDACASGAITRLKGGQPYPGFLSDVSMDVQGYAFIASSTEGEAAQESDRLGGSYFTNALLTGIRGAADVSGDGRVTLGEAYQFAFNETLVQTTTSQGGAQHPSYDIKMAGTGDFVMTDVRKMSASLILSPDYDGRFYVIDARQQLVAELQKPAGRVIELGLEPGEYRVYYERSKELLSTPMKLGEGQRQELVRGRMRPAKRLPTLRRGVSSDGPLLRDRNRLEVLTGLSSEVSTSASGARVAGSAGGFTVLHWFKPTLAFELAFLDRAIVAAERSGTFVGSTRGGVLGARFYPNVRGNLRPFAFGGLGLFDDVGVRVGSAGKGLGFGGHGGVGADLYLGRRITASTLVDFTAAAQRKSRFDVRFAAGWNWGGPRGR